jgi:hypothetical protein
MLEAIRMPDFWRRSTPVFAAEQVPMSNKSGNALHLCILQSEHC